MADPASPVEVATRIVGLVNRYDKPNISARTMLLSVDFWTDVSAALLGVDSPVGGIPVPVPPADPITLESIDPATAAVGDPDIVMTCHGTNFTEGCSIIFNGSAEPTAFVSATEINTVVKPSLASGPWTVPVFVELGSQNTDQVMFQFTTPEP